jgi:plastocyanin
MAADNWNRRVGATLAIVIGKMKFEPAPAGLRVGDTIIWANRDLFRHTAAATDRSFDIDLMPSQSAKLVLKHPGIVRFTCTYHPGMKGQMIIGR